MYHIVLFLDNDLCIECSVLTHAVPRVLRLCSVPALSAIYVLQLDANIMTPHVLDVITAATTCYMLLTVASMQYNERATKIHRAPAVQHDGLLSIKLPKLHPKYRTTFFRLLYEPSPNGPVKSIHCLQSSFRSDVKHSIWFLIFLLFVSLQLYLKLHHVQYIVN